MSEAEDPVAQSDGGLGPLVFFTVEGVMPDQFAVNYDIDPSGLWLVFETSSTNLGTTRPGDCASIRPGAGCRISYAASMDGTHLEPIGPPRGGFSRDHDVFSIALASKGEVVAFSTAEDGLDPRDHDFSEDSFAWKRGAKEVTWLSGPPQGEARSDRCQAYCGRVSINPSGGLVVFASLASDLTPADGNGAHDVFLTSLTSGERRLVSATPEGTPGNDESWTRRPQALSDDGRFVVFMSLATNLVPGIPSQAGTQAYLRDVPAGVTRLLSRLSNGQPFIGEVGIPVIDPTGRWAVVYASPQPGDVGAGAEKVVYLLDVETGRRRVISVPKGVDVTGTTSWVPSVSRDAAHIAFTSEARLVPEDDDDQLDVYVWTRASNSIILVSDPRLPGALPGLATSANIAEDGSRILFRWEDRTDAEPPWNDVSRLVYRDIPT